MMIEGFYGLDYPYGSCMTAPYGDSVSRCLLVVGGSGDQPSGYLTEELSQSMSYQRLDFCIDALAYSQTPRGSESVSPL